MLGGFYEEKELSSGKTKIVYVEDSRQAVINAIEFLADLLYPHILQYKEIRKEIDQLNEELSKILKETLKEQEGKTYDEKQEIYSRFIQEKLDYRKKMFKLLAKLIVDENYFKGATYAGL